MKRIFFILAISAAILLSGCGAAGSVPASSRADGSDISDPAVSGAASSVVSAEPQGTGFTLTSAVLSEDENRLLSLVGANALLYDYEAADKAVTVAVTSYQLRDGRLQELHTLTLPMPGSASGRIAVSFNKMVEGFRVAVENNGGVNNLEIDTDETFPKGTACVSWMAGKNGEAYAYGEEVPLVSQIASTKDMTESIAAEDLLHHPEQFADRDYEGIYLLTLTITPAN